MNVTGAECCAKVVDNKLLGMYAYNNETQHCQAWILPASPDKAPCGKENIMAFRNPPSEPKCDCERVYKTVGRENIINAYGKGNPINRAGGYWYSHPAKGECTGDQRIGDGSGCTYRLQGISKAIHAPCLYQLMDKDV